MSRNELTATEAARLSAITTADPVGSMLSLPEWLGSLINAVSRNPEGMPVWSRQPEIPTSLMPSGGQRTAIESRCLQLERMAVAGPEKRALQAVAKLVGFYATTGLSEQQAAVKAEVYLSAVNDLPAWAVEEAVTRWFRGQCGVRNYEFAPSPAVLREIADDIAKIAAGQLVVLRRILNAKALPSPIADEDRAAMAEKARAVIRGAQKVEDAA